MIYDLLLTSAGSGSSANRTGMSPVVLYFLCHKNIEVKAALEKPVITNGKKVFLFPLIVDKCLDFVVCTLRVCKSCVDLRAAIFLNVNAHVRVITDQLCYLTVLVGFRSFSLKTLKH